MKLLFRVEKWLVFLILKIGSKHHEIIDNIYIFGDEKNCSFIKEALIILKIEHPEIYKIISTQGWIITHSEMERPRILIDLEIIFLNDKIFDAEMLAIVSYIIFMGFYRKNWKSGSFLSKEIAQTEACKKTVEFLKRNNYSENIQSQYRNMYE